MALSAIPDKGFIKFFFRNFKRRPDLIPILGFLGTAFGLVTFFGIHALKDPEVSILRKQHPEPWNEYRNRQYKLITTRDYSEPCPAPEYK